MPIGKAFTDEELENLPLSRKNKILRDREYRKNKKEEKEREKENYKNNRNDTNDTNNRKPKKDQQREILMRQNHRCDICKIHMDDAHVMIEFDHIKQWSEGGKTTINNLRALCRNCHKGRDLSWAKDSEKRKEHTIKLIHLLEDSLNF